MAKRQLYLGRPRLSWHCKQFQMQRNLELVGRGGFEPPTNGPKGETRKLGYTFINNLPMLANLIVRVKRA